MSENLITNKATAWCRILFEKLTVHSLQPVKEFPAFYGTESSLPWSEEPASGPYPEPDYSET
jgi:hypothetical protein